ncbi:AAA family ATPase [Bacteroides fragilis]|jgi:exonuclease SbcC|uniref:AAA family ATPase n=1 Tax=Bacteroides fragilis TaxID=817 RepID=UPI00202F8DD4|nr:AAA family ATPase [Bacteroides fragilis]DAO85588.1 MAG TPA: STRUCTURAL MAINTENANCE OF CHROMOSOMES PROTEIN [Caudoviricetes sp.]MCM0194045.1 SMC family ATPase [Bacteroides fragilis]MCM0201395.1 SMC family ATPase [Bacteroides fragilis]MCM0211964.1 SMC family ATPase [Bacteroides fragilis]MCM0216449.1 SMC family ATPase [Bacteroides fragilis]
MWKLNKIAARNLCAFRELSYTLHQGVTTLIFGDNRDNESQRSNGSGKSALLECIAIGVTGSPLRKIKNEEIINDTADECYVMLEFSNTSYNEVFTVERELYRKGASQVHCSIERDGKPIDTDEAVQHSVDAYGKYILEKLGITRDELFNNFVLSKHKYEDFLSCSDKEKKEIINRFSNGIVVDEAIEKVLEDIAPIETRLRDAELELSGVDGRIAMLTEQMEKEENSKEECARSKAERIAAIEQTITGKRAFIREKKLELTSLSNARTDILQTDTEIQGLENSDEPLDDILEQVKIMVSAYGTLTDWNEVIESKKIQLSSVEKNLANHQTNQKNATDKQARLTDAYTALESEYALFTKQYQTRNEVVEEELKSLGIKLHNLSRTGEELRTKRRNLSAAVESLKNKLAGTITCPACKHQFLVADKEFDVIAGQQELSKKQHSLVLIGNEITEAEQHCITVEKQQRTITADRQAIRQKNDEWQQRLSTAGKDLQTATFELETMSRKEKQIRETIISLQKDIEGVRRKIFDEAFELIDAAYRTNERKKLTINDEVTAAESSIETLRATIVEINNSSPDEIIESLRASLKNYRKKSEEILNAKDKIEQTLKQLQEQEQRFNQFKSYLANTKIEALSKITNEFLASIGSDIRIQFSGYTVLKTGKLREKISVTLVRDGVDCGSFGKFSEGEKARVNLSSILAMQKLVNSNCEGDKGLDLLVLDEILAAVDEEGNMKMFESLNRLGITALVVSHGHVSEAYPHTLVIRKEHGESRIVQ